MDDPWIEDDDLWPQADCVLELPEWKDEPDGEPVSVKDVIAKVMAEIERRQQKHERRKKWRGKGSA